MTKKKGRPQHEPTEANRQKIKIMRAGGLKQKQIAAVLDINVCTLNRYYKKEVDQGADELNGMVVKSLFQNAIKGNVTAQIFWLKTRARWTENVKPEREEADLKPHEATEVIINAEPMPERYTNES